MSLILEIVKWTAFICWTVFSAYAVLGFIGLRYKTRKASYRLPPDKFEFVVVSKASKTVYNALCETLDHLVQEFSGYPVNLVIDEDAEMIDSIRGRYEDKVNIVLVPVSYRRDLIGKGRAINYFIEYHVVGDKWYGFLDDDNLVLDDTFLYEIPRYDMEGYVAMNPILVPRKGRSNITFIMDWVRYFDDLTVFRFFTGVLGKPYAGFHGELLTVKGSVLKEIGYNHWSITEDFRFSQEIVKRGYRTWQSETKVSIKSPNSIRDLIRQRGRWFKGVLLDIRYSPLKQKLFVGLRLMLWMVGVLGSWALSPLWIYWGVFYPAILGGLFYWYIYLFGIVKLGLFRYIATIPLFGVLETISFVSGLKQKTFVVIDKN